MASEKTTKELLKQMVDPTVAGVKMELVETGRKVVTAVNKALKLEVGSLKNSKDMKDMKTMLQNVLAVNDEVPKANRKKDMGSSKRGRSKTPRSRTPARATHCPPESAVKARRSTARVASPSFGAEAEEAAAERFMKTLYARPDGAAVIAQLASKKDQGVLLRKFKPDAYHEDDKDDDDDDDEDSDEDNCGPTGLKSHSVLS